MTTIRYGAFEWDDLKAIANAKKHGITFDEATTVFFDPLVLVQPDNANASRFLLLGRSSSARVLFVVYAERDGDIFRLISARKATPHERKEYEDES